MERERRARNNQGEYRKLAIIDVVYRVGICAAVLAAVCLFWIQGVPVVADNMAPTIQKGDILLVDKLAHYAVTPVRGQIVAFDEPQSGERLIGRLIAFSGERVLIQNGNLYINDAWLNEHAYLSLPSADIDAFQVPDGSVFVMFDDRTEPGIVTPLSSIVGVVRLISWPFSRLSLFV